MKKIRLGFAVAGLAALILSGCKGNTDGVAQVKSDAAGEDNAAAETEYSALDYVTLGDYIGLSVDQVETVTELDEGARELLVENYLYEKSEEVLITDRTVQEGDYVAVYYTGVQNGETVDYGTDSELEIEVGAGFLPEELEQAMIGLSAGDTTEVTVSYEEDGSYDVTYTIEVLRVYSYSTPEMDDEFAETQGYPSAEELTASLVEQEIASRNAQYEDQAKEDVLEAVIEASSCSDYPQSLYDETREQMNQEYENFWGMGLEEAFENDEETINEIVLQQLKIRLVVEAIALQEGITVSAEETEEYGQQMLQDGYFESMEELETYYSEEELAYQALYAKVKDFIYAQSVVNFVSEDEYYESYYTEEELFDDLPGDEPEDADESPETEPAEGES